jgi:FtsH-binding integral membrane protein
MQFYAYVCGIGALAGAWLMYRVVTGEWGVWKFLDGQDKRLSTSRFQTFFWTGVVIFGYSVIYSALAMQGDFNGFSDVPQNVLLALGLSAGTGVVAKAITVSQVARGQVKKEGVERDRKLSDLVNDDDDWPDLFKVQMLAWTFLASAVFITFVAHDLNSIVRTHDRPATLPDIDSAMMILMGLGQGSYLGKKLVSVPPATPKPPAGP